MLRQQFSEILLQQKIERGYTYKYISEESGVPLTTVRYALNGGGNVGINVFEKLLDFFEISVFFDVGKGAYFLT
uniref:HTH cro/C1-type domain-containing protein n=1 Tax=Vibrio phage P018-4 TaxID=3229728 RepID=A0AB39AJ98_9CAUD